MSQKYILKGLKQQTNHPIVDLYQKPKPSNNVPLRVLAAAIALSAILPMVIKTAFNFYRSTTLLCTECKPSCNIFRLHKFNTHIYTSPASGAICYTRLYCSRPFPLASPISLYLNNAMRCTVGDAFPLSLRIHDAQLQRRAVSARSSRRILIRVASS